MRISIITLFPEIFEPILNSSILKAAQLKKKVSFELINLRDFGEGPHKTVDGRVYGGGAGMLLRSDILKKALSSLVDRSAQQCYVILTAASGTPYKQSRAQELSKLEHLIIVCGHYEGVDQRFIDSYVDEEISIGDYVLTGGEIPALVIIDSITRLIPEVLKEEATINESYQSSVISHQNGIKNIQLLEHPQYTRPDEFEGKKVPKVLLSGNHAEIAKWRKEQALERTKKSRPDLLE